MHALETDRIMVRQGGDKISYYKGIAWSDRLPRLVQARMIETFQNSGAVKAVSAFRRLQSRHRVARLPD